MNRTQQRNEVLFRIVAVLLLAVLLTMRMFAGVPARYISRAEGLDSARVARYAVTVTPGSTAVSMTYSGSAVTGTYSFTVKNQNANGQVCEVKTGYQVIVTLPSPLVSGMTITLGGAAPTSVSADKKTYTFNGTKTFEAGVAATQTESLQFNLTSSFKGFNYVDVNQNSTSRNNTALYYLDNIKVDVISTQID